MKAKSFTVPLDKMREFVKKFEKASTKDKFQIFIEYADFELYTEEEEKANKNNKK